MTRFVPREKIAIIMLIILAVSLAWTIYSILSTKIYEGETRNRLEFSITIEPNSSDSGLEKLFLINSSSRYHVLELNIVADKAKGELYLKSELKVIRITMDVKEAYDRFYIFDTLNATQIILYINATLEGKET